MEKLMFLNHPKVFRHRKQKFARDCESRENPILRECTFWAEKLELHWLCLKWNCFNKRIFLAKWHTYLERRNFKETAAEKMKIVSFFYEKLLD